MQITTNVVSLNTQRHLSQTSNGLAQVLSRLSSGLRINTAKDDAAGLAISSRMEATIRGDRQAIRNMNDGVSLMQVAEGAMSNAADVVQRIRELGVQAANGSLSGSDRQALQAEANQLLQSLSTQAQNAEFNGQKITVQFGGMSAKNLGLDDVDLVRLPTLAIAHADEALDYINTERAKAGAVMSRLDSAIKNVSNMVENTSAAKSRIMDADYAQETAALTRQQILQQAGSAMLAQANAMPQMALSLLRG